MPSVIVEAPLAKLKLLRELQAEKARLDAQRATVKRWEPQPKQALAEQLASESDELLYGGAVGGGKSFWLVQHVIDEMLRFPGNRGVVFRRVFPSLNRTIVPVVRKLMREGLGRYNETMHEANFYNGSVLELATLQREHDVENFQGPQYGVIAFEELTEFLESQYTHMITRARAPVEGPRPHIISTTNPGGIGHRWVKRRFVKPEPVDLEEGAERPRSFQVWRPRATEENSTPDQPPLSRVYVPATMEDNPALMKRDPGYRARVRAATSRAKRKAFETGDWDAIDAVEGALWEQQWLDNYRVDVAPQSRLRVVAVDPSEGAEQGDFYGVCVASSGIDGRFYVEHSHGWKGQPSALIDYTVALAADVGADRVVVEKNHGGAWLVEAFRARHPHVRINTVWASDNKRTRAEPVSVLFEPVNDEPPRAVLVGHHAELEDELTTFTGEPGHPSPDRLDAMVWAVSELMQHPLRRAKRLRFYPRESAQ